MQYKEHRYRQNPTIGYRWHYMIKKFWGEREQYQHSKKIHEEVQGCHHGNIFLIDYKVFLCLELSI